MEQILFSGKIRGMLLIRLIRVNSTLFLGGIMRFRKDVLALALVVCTRVVFGGSSIPPGKWMYTDEYGQPLYSGIELVDTANLGPPYTVGIGLHDDPELRDVGYDTTPTVMYYFSYDYQFTQGWSGFKMMWEARDYPWNATGYTDIQGTFHYQPYDSLVIKYIGPLQSQKVDVYFGESYDRYSPAFVDSIGTLPSNYHATYSSDAWKTVALPLPPAPAEADRTQIREVRFIIHNAGDNSSLTSDVGNLSIDKVGLIWKSNTAIKATSNRQSLKSNRLFFTPLTNGAIALSVFSLNGKLLADKQVNVAAGKRYSIRQFASANANVSASQVHLVRIRGAGIDVHELVR